MADGKEYVSSPDELGSIHISEDVLAVTAAAAALEVEGVGSLAANLGSDIAELFSGRKNLSKGVRVTVGESGVAVDISLLVKYGATVQEVARAAQDAVAAAIENATSFQVTAVNVHVAGVTFDHLRKPKQA
ncbi:Asp23/Gls24 family envelope stress response protein [Vermiculatibacterium agrestimuris]|uniref:Asp23/Gls24 family envelope stress response protein n=1 Tax=Vermiculatibacterium agrestimuris TaxID=2941519 RepID=UPI00203E4B40|nr:Asp23/Gls24 family envelope stress response protein [Vermiculatibacterium agrestimuris]